MKSLKSIFDIVQWMDPTVRAAFEDATRRRRITAGQIIYVQGDDAHEMYRIVSGSVRLSVMRDDGREVVFLRFEPGDCFGEASLIDAEPRPQTAAAVTDVELEVLEGASFRKLRADHRSFDEALLQLLSRQMRFASNLYMDLSLQDLPRRIARRILEAVRAAGDRTEEQTPLKLLLSQSEIASMVSASRQTVNRVLQQMQSEGVIATEYNNIVVTNPERLNDLASRD